ncbi:restriction endonuclease subunit S [Candidatus Saccharibacteria bacterium]|nr:restriction endonuclease subunit S [Candidatus Saccharibacteria bacterium]
MIDKGYARHYQFLEKMKVEIPSADEQKRIVNKIEELFSELDSAVETLKKTKEQLAVYRQSVLKEAFKGNFTEVWRKRNKIQKDWMAAPIQGFIKKEKNSLKAGPFGSALKKEFYVPSGYKVYGQEQVIAGDETIGNYYINQAKYEDLISCKVAPNDVLISLVGTVGKVLVLSPKCEAGIINPRLIKISLDSSKMLPYFFKYYFESGYLKSLYKQKVHGETMDVLNMGMIKELPFPSCSVDEQREVLKEIGRHFSLCENIEKTVNDALTQADAMRQSILKKAFEGGL